MNNVPQHLFLFAGEPSGDLHGSRLVRQLRKLSPEMHITGVAGPQMRQEGVQGPLRMEDFEVMGFSDVLKSLPKLIKQFFSVRNAILEQKPDAVVLIDYPGFNLRLAKALRKKGFQGKIIQYVSPSVWAWGQHRIREMESSLDLLMSIYPFESSYFSNSSLSVQYVGSPIQEYIRQHSYDSNWKKKLGIPDTSCMIALFPGSRKGEVQRNLPILLEAAARLKKDHPEILFGISCFNASTENFLNQGMEPFKELKGALYRIPKEYTYELMRDSRCALAKSGTITLELALHHCPTVVIYRLSTLNRLYAKYLLKVKLPHYCIVNVLAQREAFPELIERGCDASNLYSQASSLILESPQRKTCLQSCQEVVARLGRQHASEGAATSILKALQC